MNTALCQSRHTPAFCTAFILVLGLCTIFTPCATAQTAQFLGSQSTLVTGLAYPLGVATDSAGNIYIADTDNNWVLKETPNNSGGYTSSVVASSLINPEGLAVDGAGNVYVGVPNNGEVLKETPKNGGYVESLVRTGVAAAALGTDAAGNVYIGDTGLSHVLKETWSNGHWVESTIGHNMSGPRSVAVDSKGNVFVADGSYAYKETLSNGAYSQSILGSGYSEPQSVAVDAGGIVYIADPGKNNVLRETPSGSGYTQSVLTVVSALNQPDAIAVDNLGAVIIANSVPGTLVRVNPYGADFGNVQIGKTSPPQTLLFNFSVGGTLNNLLLLAQGIGSMDFGNAGTGTCSQGTFYFNSVRCTVNVTFSPKYAGDRNGAVVFRNSSLQTFVSTYIHGMGLAPQMTYLPPLQRSVHYSTAGQAPPEGVAVDGNGVVYIADTNNNVVRREVPYHNTYNESTIGTGLASPTALALDGAGNLFVADTGNGRVVKLTPEGNGSWSESLVQSGLSSPYGVAVGPDGAVYISDTFNSHVLKETPTGPTTYASTTIPISGLNHPYGIAVDGRGNLFVSDVANDDVLKLTRTLEGYTQSTLASSLSAVFGIAVDSMDNVYLALRDNATILRYVPTGNSYVDHAVSINGLLKPFAVTVDARGNVYVADVGNDDVAESDFADLPYLNFADTEKGETSADSPKIVTIQNAGNLPLAFPAPNTGHNPSIAANFTLDSAIPGTCPVLNPGSSQYNLTMGASCTLYISFTPGTTGSISGSLVLTDNALDGGNAPVQQTISLAGNGLKIPTQVHWSTPQAITYGTALGATQLNATATDNSSNTVAGNFVYSPAAGKVPPAGSNMLSVNFTPTDATDYTNSTGNTTLTVNKAVLTVSAKAASKSYGSANPSFTYTITGFVNGDTAATAVTGTPALTSTAVAGSPVGAYPIQAALGTLAAANYTFNFVNSTLTVNKANLNITADDLNVLYGKPIPPLTWTPTGFVNGDTATVLSGAPTESTTATAGSPGGTYPINIGAGTLAATNYSFTFNNGTLTITYLGTVATPVIAPNGGTFTGSTDVTITDATAGASIHYTTDGSTPFSGSPSYTGPIHVTSSQTIKALALRWGYSNSAVATAKFTIN